MDTEQVTRTLPVNSRVRVEPPGAAWRFVLDTGRVIAATRDDRYVVDLDYPAFLHAPGKPDTRESRLIVPRENLTLIGDD